MQTSSNLVKTIRAQINRPFLQMDPECFASIPPKVVTGKHVRKD